MFLRVEETRTLPVASDARFEEPLLGRLKRALLRRFEIISGHVETVTIMRMWREFTARCVQPAGAKWILCCVAAALVFGASGCIMGPCGETGCTGHACFPAWRRARDRASCWYPDSLSHGYRTTTWHPWPVECIDCESSYYEVDDRLPASGREIITPPPGYRTPQPLPEEPIPPTVSPEAPDPGVGPSEPVKFSVEPASYHAEPRPVQVRRPDLLGTDAAHGPGRPILWAAPVPYSAEQSRHTADEHATPLPAVSTACSEHTDCHGSDSCNCMAHFPPL